MINERTRFSAVTGNHTLLNKLSSKSIGYLSAYLIIVELLICMISICGVLKKY
jgi:hypothetical protein